MQLHQGCKQVLGSQEVTGRCIQRKLIETFDGLGISLLLTSNPAINYTVFDQLKNRLLKGNQDKVNKHKSPEVLSAFSAFVLGAISKSIATCLTYPAIRCKVMIQAAETSDAEKSKRKQKAHKTIPGVLYAIYRKEGVSGYFKGLQAQILKTVLSSALLLMIKEKISASTWVFILATQKFLLLNQGTSQKDVADLYPSIGSLKPIRIVYIDDLYL
ncbi:hypothetical protein Leryth_016398 [Lithospermum erythrorhizon]|nr:hypothetical protein Leryth_016398 [Lithospermum erythrorhizon]